jgi:hypothetical protein
MLVSLWSLRPSAAEVLEIGELAGKRKRGGVYSEKRDAAFHRVQDGLELLIGGLHQVPVATVVHDELPVAQLAPH